MNQFVPSEVCLKCQGCCRFRHRDSAWSPCLTEEEIENFIDKEGIPPASITIDKRLNLIPNPKGEGFICPFFDIDGNKCKVYGVRPFECRLYPFLLNLRGKRAILTVDLNCPYVRENMNSGEFKAYCEYLAAFLNSPEQIRMLKDNPQLLQAYEEVAEIMELSLPDQPH